MSIGLHDPRLTAYALGELTGAEKAEVESALERSAALRRAVDEIRRAGEAISVVLDQESRAGLTEEQVAAITRRAEERRQPRQLWVSLAGLSAAACVLLAFFLARPDLTVTRPRQEALQKVVLAPLDRAATTTTPPPSSSAPAKDLEAEPSVRHSRIQYQNSAIDKTSPSPAEADASTRAKVAAVETTSGPRAQARSDKAAPSAVPAARLAVGAEAPASVPAGQAAVLAAPGTTSPAKKANVAAGTPLNESVTVIAQTPALAIEAATMELPARAKDLPLNGRDVIGLLKLKPGLASNFADAGEAGQETFNTESYARVDENPFRLVLQNPLSTFSIDVDTASYSNVRRFINGGSLPPADAVRIEELVNYFSYDYPQPVGGHPFSVTTEVAEAPWNRQHLLVRIGLKGRELSQRDRPVSNLVFLIDVSGSMDEPNKLPLLIRAMKLLVGRLSGTDRVAIVVYAGSSGVVLPSTSGNQRAAIEEALEDLRAGGSTHGSAGIRKAYAIARENFVKGGINRVILATDGDFNVGTTSQGELTRLIEEEAKSGVFLSVLGFGMGNYKDSTLEGLADKGNGNYGYIDNINEARKLLVEQMDGTLVTIAKDVKIQVEFNPAQVSGYRLIGYENRSLRDEDFNDDRKDAGEIGAGHTVTALYELVPVGALVDAVAIDALKYQRPAGVDGRFAHELMTVKFRYKRPDEDFSNLIEVPVVDAGLHLAGVSDDFRFAAAVAEFGMALRNSKQSGEASFSSVLELAGQGMGPDRFGYRREFIDLVREAQRLAR